MWWYKISSKVLEAKVEGYSIADILALTVDEAIEKFSDSQVLYDRFKH